MCSFLGLGDSAVFYCMLCLFVLGSYWKTQVSSPIMICLRVSRSSLIFSCDDLPKSIQIVFNFLQHVFTKLGSASSLLTKSWAPFRHTPFASPDHAARLFALILCLGSGHLIFVLSTCDHYALLLHSSDVFICPHCGRLSHFGTFCTSLLPLSKCLCHLKICILDITSSPKPL